MTPAKLLCKLINCKEAGILSRKEIMDFKGFRYQDGTRNSWCCGKLSLLIVLVVVCNIIDFSGELYDSHTNFILALK